MKSKNEFKQIDIKRGVCYYVDDIVNGTKINFNNTLLNKKLHEHISVYNISSKCPRGPKPLRIWFDKIDGCIISLDGIIKHLLLFDYGCLIKLVIRLNILSKKVVLQIVLIILLERSKLIHIILFLLKKYELFTML